MSTSWFAATLLIPPFLLISLAIFVWQKRSSKNGIEFILLLLSVALWGLASAGGKFFVDLDTRIWIAKLQYLGIIAVAPCCVAVALRSRGEAPGRITRWLSLISIPSLMTLGLVMTNEWHGVFWQTARVEHAAGIPILEFGYGPGFWFHVAWSYTLLASAVGLLIAKWAQSWSYYRGEAVWVLAGIAAPVAANIAYLSRTGFDSNLDLTPAAFAVTAFCLGWPLLFRDGIFDVVRLAKREILDHMADGALVVDQRNRLIYVNVSARRILGLTQVRVPCALENALGDHPDILALNSSSAEGARELEIEVEGARRTFDLVRTGLCDPRGQLVSRLVVLRDITGRKRAAERISVSEDALRKVIDLVPHHIYVKDEDGRFLLVNQATADSLGTQPDLLVGSDIGEMKFRRSEVEKIHATDREVIEGHERCSVIEKIATRDGTSVVFQTTKIPFAFPPTGTPALLGISIDVTERLRNDEKIRRLAFFDSLTGLPNRRRFMERLSCALETAKRKDFRLSVMFLDLDHFKDVNDRLGHGSGDELLREVSTRLQDCVRFSDHLAFGTSEYEDDAVSRLAGDEFTILLTDINACTDGARVALRILESISQPFEIDGETVTIQMSIGMASYPEDGADIDTLMHCADQAMYQAKRTGQGFAFFDPSTRERAARRHRIESELRHAMDTQEFQMRFEPMRNVFSGRVSGGEAQVHWDSELLGSIGPDEFTAIAEETGLVHQLGECQLRGTCEELAKWKEQGLRLPRISVNVSAVQLRDRLFVTRLRRILNETGVTIGEMELELTESTSRATDEATNQTLRALRDMGARLSLDDFGTGSSSIRNLRSSEFERIKIGRCFVRELSANRDDAIIASGIVGIAHGLGISVVAVGVETEAQAECLRAMQCDELQGALLSDPLPAAEFAALFQREKSAS
jgi:diguanylate cyclase (GGDEF)-like protein/PAS domain S-box-containing protein